MALHDIIKANLALRFSGDSRCPLLLACVRPCIPQSYYCLLHGRPSMNHVTQHTIRYVARDGDAANNSHCL